jgi:hypothetical protein
MEAELNVDVEVSVGVDATVTDLSGAPCELWVGGGIWVSLGSGSMGAPLKMALMIFSTENKLSRSKSMIVTSFGS